MALGAICDYTDQGRNGGEGTRRSMNGAAARRASLLLGLSLLLGACGHHDFDADSAGEDDSGVNAYPKNYKSDILAAAHAYLNYPTAIHDAAISDLTMKSVGNETRYVVCVKFNAKKNASEYAGEKEVAAMFLAGRFDRFVETPKDLCAGAAYAPFPELQKLPP
jgi:hypothetical protein